tara:strand:- start:623 stop:790 length:168 start_codon:yes stop_codon:yes gene_type:complete
VRDKVTSILDNTKDNDFFPMVEKPLYRFLLYTVVWIVGGILIILPAAAAAAFISK